MTEYRTIEAGEMYASADVGNSSVKLILTDEHGKKARKQPSVISFLPVVPQFEDEDLAVLVANLHKNMVAHITSESLKRNGLYAVGELANVHGGNGFNIKHHKKAEHDLTIIQPMAMIATMAVQNAYKRFGELPKKIECNVQYTSAIPVVDYTKAEAKTLENRLKGTHILIVYVGEGHRVIVIINVTGAKVVQEGIPAFYALYGGSPNLFESYNKRYNVNFDGKNFASRKILFVDIGDGTLELIYVENGKPVVMKSSGARLGVGHASEKALKSFKSHYNFRAAISRSNFMEKVLTDSDKWHTEAVNELDSAIFEQEQQIYDAIIDTIENTLSYDLDDVVIFGGGTNVFTHLENQLIDYADGYKMRVLWIDGKDSALLNAIGLDELNTRLYFKKEV